MHIQCNSEVRACNRCCSGKAVIITYSGGVFVALGIQHAVCMRDIVICGRSSSAVCFHVVS
jgi:hypothetical protein